MRFERRQPAVVVRNDTANSTVAKAQAEQVRPVAPSESERDWTCSPSR